MRFFIFLTLMALAIPSYSADFKSLQLNDLETGKVFRFSEIKAKLIIVDFWASWCGPCQESLPFFESLHQKYKDKGLVVVGIAMDDDLKNSKDFLKNQKINFKMVYGGGGGIQSDFGIDAIPRTMILDSELKIVKVIKGFGVGKKEIFDTIIKEKVIQKK